MKALNQSSFLNDLLETIVLYTAKEKHLGGFDSDLALSESRARNYKL